MIHDIMEMLDTKSNINVFHQDGTVRKGLMKLRDIELGKLHGLCTGIYFKERDNQDAEETFINAFLHLTGLGTDKEAIPIKCCSECNPNSRTISGTEQALQA
jgi:hypothetical protein